MSEQTVTGICTEIAQKPGSDWCEFHIDAGGKYPVKMSTKLQPLIELGKAVGANLATWTYNEVDSGKPNPHKPGSNFINKYLESVEVGGTQNPPQSVATPGDAAQARPPALGSDKDRLIVRQTCLKAAATRLEGLASQDPAGDTLELAARFEKWVSLGILEDLPF
jgi:hypothetical protein